MRIVCRISGEEMFLSEEFKDEPLVRGTHPIFFAPVKSLLAKSRKWSQGGYQEKEEKLLFLALLHATERVDWEVPANPSVSTVNKYMEGLVRFVGWYDAVSAAGLRLPTLRITSNNYDLANIGIYLNSCYECRQEWMTSSSRKHLQDLVEQEEYTLQKLIFEGKETEQFSGKLWRWTRKVISDKLAKVDPSKLEDWEEIFNTKPNQELFKFHIEEVECLHAFLAEHLFEDGSYSSGSGMSYAMKVLSHVAKLYNVSKGGWMGLISSNLGGPGKTFSIHSDNKEDTSDFEIATIVSGAPSAEPNRRDYIGRLSDYMRDRAAYTLSILSKNSSNQKGL